MSPIPPGLFRVAAGSEVACGARSTWAMLRGTAGGWGRHGEPKHTDRAWRTGSDRSLSILGGRDGTYCMDRAAMPGACSVPGVVRIVLVLWRIRMVKGDEVC